MQSMWKFVGTEDFKITGRMFSITHPTVQTLLEATSTILATGSKLFENDEEMKPAVKTWLLEEEIFKT